MPVSGDFKLSSFRSKFVPVRPNLFTARITLGTNLSSLYNEIKDTFEFRVESAEFPGRNFAVGEIQGGGGPAVKVMQDVIYSDITLTIICSEDFKERKFFDNWMNYMYKDFKYAGILYAGTNSRGLHAYYNDYAKFNTLTIYQWRQDGTLIHTSEMYEIFPTSLSSMTANWDERDTYQRFTVTLAYNRMQMK